MSRLRDGWWNNIGKKVISNMMLHTNGRACKTNVLICEAETVQGYKGI